MLYCHHRYFHIQYNCHSKNYLLILVFHNLFPHAQKGFYYLELFCLWLFRFLLQSKKISHIFNSSVVDFSLLFKNILYIFKCGIIYLFFQSVTIPYTFNYVVFHFWNLFHTLSFPSLYITKIFVFIFKKNTNLLYSL